MRVLSLLLAAPAFGEVSSSCPRTAYAWDGVEVWGLTSSPAVSAAECAAACCAMPPASCNVWQFCPSGAAGCSPSGTCWVGLFSGTNHPVSGWVSNSSVAPPPPAAPFFVNVTSMPAAGVSIPGILPAASPAGVVRALDTRSQLLGGVRTLPLAGELQPSRVPLDSWAGDLAAMKAGGLDVVSSYIVWEHIEEVRGTLDFSGNRNVSAYLAAAQAAGLVVALRIGPWVHGECRNGGVPDWAMSVPGFRSNSSAWLDAVAPYYAALAQHLQGSAWQDGGPVVQIQLDNETPDTAYLEALRALAESLGIKPGLYWQVTGWPTPDSEPPTGTYVPFYGG